MFTLDGWLAIGTVVTVFSLLMLKRRIQVEILFMGGMLFVTLTGVIEPGQALKGFSSSAVIAIAALYVVAAALRNTGVLDWIGNKLFR